MCSPVAGVEFPRGHLLKPSSSAIFYGQYFSAYYTKKFKELMLNRKRRKEIIVAVGIIVGLLAIMTLISLIA